MNQFFCVPRFARLFLAHVTEYRRDYFWFFVVTCVVDLIFLMIAFWARSDFAFVPFQYSGQAGWYFVGLFISGIIFAARYFRQLTKPGAELILLMRPASSFEKCLLAICVISVLYPLIYTLCFAVLNFPMVQLTHALYRAPVVCKTCPDAPIPNFGFFIPFVSKGSLDNFELTRESAARYQLFMFLVLWSVQALLVGGTVFFRRSALLKTSLSLFLLFVVLSWLGCPPQMGAFWDQNKTGPVAADSIELVLSLMEWLGLPALLWVMVYFHIKEREVA